MSNNPSDEAKKSRIDPKPAETFIQPEPDELSEAELEKAAGGACTPPSNCAPFSKAHDA